MKLEGEFTFQGTCQEVWNAILDPEILAAALPGAKKMEKVSDTEYVSVMEVRVGPVTGVFDATVKLDNVEDFKSYTMIVEGKGGPGFAKGTSEIQFIEQGETTLMKYQAQLQVGGRLASVGQRLLDTVGKSMTKQSLEAINDALQARLSGGSVDANKPTQAKFALGVFVDVVKETLLSRSALWAGAIFLIIIVAVMILMQIARSQ